MRPIPVIAIFDIGKTNKKFFLFNEQYQIEYETAVQFPEIKDEDGFPCDDLPKIEQWVKATIQEINALAQYEIKAVNFSAYGATLVYTDENGKAIAPLYNYLKPFSVTLSDIFYANYGGADQFSLVTCSPVLGNLNAGIALYGISRAKPQLFNRLTFAIFLPQYISSLITQTCFADLTSIGCHTGLWNFKQNAYHDWVSKEQIIHKLAPIVSSSYVVEVKLQDRFIKAGIGLHDSSSALIPYLISCKDPFILLSTGTWSISLNPFNHLPLTKAELEEDCLCYISYKGHPVKASRLFSGHEHEQQVKLLATHFGKTELAAMQVAFDTSFQPKIDVPSLLTEQAGGLKASLFAKRNLNEFVTFEEAYHQLIYDLVLAQCQAIDLIMTPDVQQIFVDGGFAKNEIFMHFLATAMPSIKVCAASVSQASAIGAALAIHEHWNSHSIPANLVMLKEYDS
jgi:sugar (pentulose or hexulose) kinase